MNYDEWFIKQTTIYGQVKKPIRYKIGQWKALKYFKEFIESANCYDAGCATGDGMLSMYYLGAKYVCGNDINLQKIGIADNLGLDVIQKDAKLVDYWGMWFDFIWCSHTLEHVLEPKKFLEALKEYLVPGGVLGIVVPYPDTGNSDAHVASEELGLYVNDGAATFVSYLESIGFDVLFSKIDDYREPEVWVACKKRE